MAIPVVFRTSICEDAVTHPGYCADADTVPSGKFALVCVDDDTVPAGSNGTTCVEDDTIPLGNAACTCAEDDTVPPTVLNLSV